MEQVFRIEIPVEAIDKTDTAAMARLQDALQKIFSSMKSNKDAAKEVFSAIEKGAEKADKAAEDAGESAGRIFTDAERSSDKFTQRMEKSNRTLRQMFKEKLQLTIAAIDRASPVLKDIWNNAKGLAGKTWNVAVRMKDFITAPFRKLYNWISSPITIALSVAGIGLSATDVLSTFNEFETGMSGVQALTGATGEEFILLKQTAKDLGASTAFSASQAAEGMQNLASAGFTTSEIVAAMPGMLDLAASSGEDLAASSDIAASTLRGFGMEASEAAHVADVLAQTAAETNATVSDTGEAMKYIAPIANTMGLAFEEVAASIGIMADSGIKGSQAGTTLRGALSRLAKPTEDMLETMKKLNLSFYDSNGQMKSISSIVRMLQTNMAGLTDAEKQNALVTLFGQESLSGIMVLMEAGADKLESLTKAYENCEGAASEMSKVRLDNLAGDMEELGGAVETAQLELMEKLDPYLRKGVQWLTGKIPEIQAQLEGAIDAAIQKGGELSAFLGSVFDSSEFQNADGFAGKFFVAWDKIIAEPFEDWWSSGGEEKMLGAVSDFGETVGELLSGIVRGIFAAIKGEEIDFEGLNLTGVAQAGAEAGQTFVSSFLSGLDLGNLFGEMPGLLKAGTVGFSAIKIGQGGFGLVKTLSALKTAFTGVAAPAAAAQTATAAMGETALASAAGIGKTATILGTLKTALAAVPVWGWVALASLTALTVGVKMYNDEQERHRQELLNTGKSAMEMADNYDKTIRGIQTVTKFMESYNQPELEVKTSVQPIPETTIEQSIERLEQRQIEIETVLANGGLDESETAKLEAQRLEIEAQKIALGFTLREPNDTEKESIRTQLSDMEGMAVELEALINSGTLSPEMEAELNQQIANLELSSLLLKATLDPLTEEEITRLKDELTRTEKKRVEIEAQIAGGGLPPEQVSDLNKEIDDLNSREVLIKATLGQLDKQEVAQYASQQLGVDYAELVKASGGRFTQEDVERGRITQEVYDEWRAEQTIIAENQLRDLRTEVEGGRENIPELIERRTAAQETREQYGAMAGDNFNDERFLSGLETQRQTLLSKYMAGEISDEELFSGGMDIINKAREHQWSDLWGAPANFETMQPDQLFGKMTGGLFGTGLFGHWEADSSVNPFGSAFDEINRRISERDTNSDNAGSEATAYNAALNEQYQSEVRLIERENFAGFGVDSELSMASLGDLAAQYAELDEAGKQMFQNALEGLAQLNATADYITEEEKTSGQALIEQAQQSAVTPANTEVLGEIQEKLRGIAEEYSGLSGEEQEAFNAGNIEAVNAALDGLGLEKIESLSQINSVLTDIANIDPSGLNFDAAAASLEALGGDASSAREKVNAVKAELEQLEGTYTATIQVKQTGSASVSLPGGAVKQNAEGGIYDGAMLSWVAEDGPEAIIPLGAKRRERGLDLWLQAGKMLGVEEFAEGGIAAPYASLLGKMDDEPESKGGFAPSNGGGARVIEVSVSANPTYQITGEDSEGIMDKLRANAHELAELLAGELADEFEDIVTNMV